MKILNQFRLYACKLLTLLIAVSAFTTPSSFAASNKKVLMVISGYGQEEGAKTPGFEFDEFAKAYWVFKDNGIKLDIASPQGGSVVADKYDANKPYNARILTDSEAMTSLSHSLSTKALDPKNYDGIFIVGGKGAMFDLPKDEALKKVIASVYQQQGIIAAVCHGPAALVDVKLDDGSYLVANKSVNAFTNQEEQLFGKQWVEQFEFMLQDKLIERGANYESSPIMLSHVAEDMRLITGQNPASTVPVATALVKSLGITPSVQKPYIDDNTLAVIARLLAGDKGAAGEFENNPDEYQLALVGMYGFYYQKVAETQQQFEHALTLMMLAQKDINNPMLDMQIAKTQHQLGKTIAAKATLKQLLTAKPDFKPAIDMLQTAF